MAADARVLCASNPLRLTCLLAASLAFCLAAARAQTPAKSYADLVAQAESGDPKTDYTALRRAYAALPDYDSRNAEVMKLYKEVDKYNEYFVTKQGDHCSEISVISDRILAIEYTSIPAHSFRNGCILKSGNRLQMPRESFAEIGLMRSILSSGDGKSIATSFIVVTLDEEWMMLALANVEVDDLACHKSLLKVDGHYYDHIETYDDHGVYKVDIYFNVDAVEANTRHALPAEIARTCTGGLK